VDDFFKTIFHYSALHCMLQPFFIDHSSKSTTFIDPRLPTEAPVLHASVLNYTSNSSSSSVPPRPRHSNANEIEVGNRDVTSRQQIIEPIPIGEGTEYGERPNRHMDKDKETFSKADKVTFHLGLCSIIWLVCIHVNRFSYWC